MPDAGRAHASLALEGIGSDLQMPALTPIHRAEQGKSGKRLTHCRLPGRSNMECLHEA